MSTFIDELLEEYHEFLPLDVIVKLTVRKWISKKKKPKEIKTLIKEENSKYFTNFKKNMTDAKKNNLQQVFELYDKPDNNKISRLGKNYPSIRNLIYLIGISNFIDATLNKYPFPSLIGFPYNNWTDRRMHKYIRLYFKIPRNTTNKPYKMPSIETIHNSLDIKKYKCLLWYSLEEVLKFFINDNDKYDYYYIHMENKEYPISEEDLKNPKKASRYNSTFFSSIFYLDKEPKVYPKIYSPSYNCDKDLIVLDAIFHRFLRLSYTEEKKTGLFSRGHSPVFFVKKKWFKEFLNQYGKSLKEIPYYHFILFGTEKELTETLAKTCLNTKLDYLSCGFTKIFEKTKDISTIPLNSRMEKGKYIAEVLEILNDFLDE